MKNVCKVLMASIALSALPMATHAEVRAMNNDHPRDCSKLTDAKKKARCEALNKALAECKAEGKMLASSLMPA